MTLTFFSRPIQARTPLHGSSPGRLAQAIAVAAAFWLTGCTTPLEASGDIQPEASSGLQKKTGWEFRQEAVAAANPLATEAGARILRAGGSAIDATVAVQMVLALVEPQSSGIGGGAFLMHHDGKRLQAFDGRETAPASAGPDLFLAANGNPMPFKEAVVGGRSVGVPGAVRMLSMAHQQHGRLPWAQLIQPAIDLAERGFAISPRLHQLLAKDETLKEDPVARAYFFAPDGEPYPVGHRLRNPELAYVLREIAIKGPHALHSGAIAEAIVRKVRTHPTNPGGMTAQDLASYQAKERSSLCFDLASTGRMLSVCGFPPPSSGPVAIGQIIGLLERAQGRASPWRNEGIDTEWLHRYAEASRLAFADRAKYVADPDFVDPPAGGWTSLLQPAYLDQRAALISATRMPAVQAGDPGKLTSAYAPMPEQPEHGTSHISVVDQYGNAVSMTTTIESGFGARIMVNTDGTRSGGFLLNNELTDFSFTPTDEQGKPIANRVEPGKRPRSSMAPIMVFDKNSGELLMSLGSPGGAFIIHYVAKVLMGTQWWGLPPQAAIDLPNAGTTGGPLVLEAERYTADAVKTIEAKGHKVVQVPLTSGLQALQRGRKDRQLVWLGGADPRREGDVMGK